MTKTLLLRVLASAIDGVAAIALTLLLATSVGELVSTRAVHALEIGNPDTLWRGGIPMMISIYGNISFALPLGLFLVSLNEPIAGNALGKIVTRLQVVAIDAGPAGGHTLWRRTLVKTAGLWAFTVAILSGWWQLVIVALVISTVSMVGHLLVLGPAGRALHDRVAGTRVVPSNPADDPSV